MAYTCMVVVTVAVVVNVKHTVYNYFTRYRKCGVGHYWRKNDADDSTATAEWSFSFHPFYLTCYTMNNYCLFCYFTLSDVTNLKLYTVIYYIILLSKYSNQIESNQSKTIQLVNKFINKSRHLHVFYII